MQGDLSALRSLALYADADLESSAFLRHFYAHAALARAPLLDLGHYASRLGNPFHEALRMQASAKGQSCENPQNGCGLDAFFVV